MLTERERAKAKYHIDGIANTKYEEVRAAHWLALNDLADNDVAKAKEIDNMKRLAVGALIANIRRTVDGVGR